MDIEFTKGVRLDTATSALKPDRSMPNWRRALQVANASASAHIHAVFAHNRHLAPKVRAFVDFLAERLQAL